MFNDMDSILNIFNYLIYIAIIVLNFYLFYKAGRVYTLILASAFLVKVTRTFLLYDLLGSTANIVFLIIENIAVLTAISIFFKRNYKKKSIKKIVG